VVTTGSEVFKGRIEDKFGPVMKEKILFFGGEYLGQIICPDNIEEIAAANYSFKERGAELIINTGGMSVDPDDVTPSAIKSLGAEIITYGVPAQPGNMVLMAYWGHIALVGAPGCAMFSKTTILDIILPRIFAGAVLSRDDFAVMGAGGLCRKCSVCHYPVCYFGRQGLLNGI
jgi:molybdopterin biosynthesis enzyme